MISPGYDTWVQKQKETKKKVRPHGQHEREKVEAPKRRSEAIYKWKETTSILMCPFVNTKKQSDGNATWKQSDDTKKNKYAKDKGAWWISRDVFPTISIGRVVSIPIG